MKNFKKLTVAVISLMMVCTSMEGFAFGTSADISTKDDGITITLNKNDNLSFSVNESGKSTVTYNGETIVYKEYEYVELTGELENGFTVKSGEHNIALNDVTINDSIVINPNAIANMNIEGTNKVTAKASQNVGKAGINVPKEATLNLFGNGKLTAIGSDSEKTIGGAGIGGNNNETAGNINIESGTITALGGTLAAQIGSGTYGDNGGNITISSKANIVTTEGWFGRLNTIFVPSYP